jgi:hypothetical protein
MKEYTHNQPTIEENVRKIFPEIGRKLEQMFPDSRYGIMVTSVNTDNYKIIAASGQTDEIAYIGSVGKMPWMVGGAKIFEQKGIPFDEPIVPIIVDEGILEDISHAVINPPPLEGDSPDIDAFVRRGIMPLLEQDGVVKRKRDGVYDIVSPLDRYVATGPIGLLSMEQIIEETLGPSSNYSLLFLKNWMIQNGVKVPGDYIQNVVHEVLGNDAKWTVSGSSKIGQNALGNYATLPEVLTMFKCIGNADPRLGISREANEAMIDAMKKHIYDPKLELTYRSRRAFGKSGYLGTIENGDIQELTQRYQLDTKYRWLSNTMAVERVATDNGVLDAAWYAGIPHNQPKEQFEDIKNQAADIMVNGLAKVFRL